MSKQEATEPMTNQELQVFHQIASALHAVTDLDELLELVLHHVKTALEIEGCSIALHDPEAKEFYFIRTVEDAQPALENDDKELRFPENVGVGGDVYLTNRTTIINDVTQDQRFFTQVNSSSGFITRSMICTPLHARQQVNGLLRPQQTKR